MSTPLETAKTNKRCAPQPTRNGSRPLGHNFRRTSKQSSPRIPDTLALLTMGSSSTGGRPVTRQHNHEYPPPSKWFKPRREKKRRASPPNGSRACGHNFRRTSKQSSHCILHTFPLLVVQFLSFGGYAVIRQHNHEHPPQGPKKNKRRALAPHPTPNGSRPLGQGFRRT